MDEFEFYNKHYLKTREDGAITDAWSDGPLRDLKKRRVSIWKT